MVKKHILKYIISAVLFISCLSGYSLDNPDVANYVKIFKTRSGQYLKGFNTAKNNYEYATINAKYKAFLEGELNKAYRALMKQLKKNEQIKLSISQKEWLKYRTTESEFINSNWNRNSFGSSAVISKIDYNNSITSDRIIVLLQYLQNYISHDY
ncbi:MAG TPA: lysozyme inhibitor LprI family protein [Victivallales bacterium]|nr:lysozyme inhibitor LprI family protein [Victivallales bacterium]